MKYMSRPKSAALKDSDVDIADILGQKYRYHIGVSLGDIDPALIQRLYDQVGLSFSEQNYCRSDEPISFKFVVTVGPTDGKKVY